DAQHLLRLADVARDAHGTHQRHEAVADVQVALHLAGGLADRLDDQRDGAALAVVVGYGERDALAVLARHDDHELAGARRLRGQRVTHREAEGAVRKALPRHDRVAGGAGAHRHALALGSLRVYPEDPRLAIRACADEPGPAQEPAPIAALVALRYLEGSPPS